MGQVARKVGQVARSLKVRGSGNKNIKSGSGNKNIKSGSGRKIIKSGSCSKIINNKGVR